MSEVCHDLHLCSYAYQNRHFYELPSTRRRCPITPSYFDRINHLYKSSLDWWFRPCVLLSRNTPRGQSICKNLCKEVISHLSETLLDQWISRCFFFCLRSFTNDIATHNFSLYDPYMHEKFLCNIFPCKFVVSKGCIMTTSALADCDCSQIVLRLFEEIMKTTDKDCIH